MLIGNWSGNSHPQWKLTSKHNKLWIRTGSSGDLLWAR